MSFINKVQLITYPDSLGGDLKSLKIVLNKYFNGLFLGGVHILPPFPSSGDRGFAPLTYFEIERNFGTWKDIENLSEHYNLMLDLMVNHISRQSIFFQDYVKKGVNSPYKNLFLPVTKLWKDGIPKQNDIDKMFLRRSLPYSSYKIGGTEQETKLWTTFGKTDPSEQIDLDINSIETKDLLESILKNFSSHGVRFVRLDAVGYIIKKRGTSCFFITPEIYEFLDWINEIANQNNIIILPEVHAISEIQFKLAARGYWIYDFILPYLILEALINKDLAKLKDYIQNRPHKQITMLDCHDGIPIKPDLDGLVSSNQAQKIVDHCQANGGNLSLVFSDKHKNVDGFDVHQIRCTYYDALNKDDDLYLIARAIQFFVPGVPQVYYTGLLFGENDFDRSEVTGDGREINRHNFSLDEIEKIVNTNKFNRLEKLIKFRNHHNSFNGDFTLLETGSKQISIRWQNSDQCICSLFIDLENKTGIIKYSDEDNPGGVFFI